MSSNFFYSPHSQLISYNYTKASRKYLHNSTLPLSLQEFFNSAEAITLKAPVIILEDQLRPTKTLLFQWISLHKLKQNNKSKDIIIKHFCSTGKPNDSPAFMLYSIISSIKQALFINNSVDVEPQRIRKYFAYWLTLANQVIQQQQLSQQLNNVGNLIIVIQSVDQLDSHSLDLFLWFPKELPQRIRIIFTLKASSYENLQCEKFNGMTFSCQQAVLPSQITLPLQKQFLRLKFENESQKKCCQNVMKELGKGQSVHVASIIFKMLYPSDNLALTPFKSFQRANKIGLSTYAFITLQKFYQLFISILIQQDSQADLLLHALTQTGRGLLEHQISSLGVQKLQFHYIFSNLLPVILQFGNRFMIKSAKFRRALKKVSRLQFANISIKNMLLAQKPKQPQLDWLKEMIFHLSETNQLTAIKDLLTPIQNFLILYNPYYKFQLYSHWMEIIRKICVDPVDEFDKALFSFKNQYKPTASQLFKIILQISKFLQHFSCFEKRQTPSFLHPKIISRPQDMHSLTLYCKFNEQKLLLNYQDEQTHFKKTSLKSLIKQKLTKIKARSKPQTKNDQEVQSSKKSGQRIYSIYKMIDAVFSKEQQVSVQNSLGKHKFREGYEREVRRFLEQIGILKHNYFLNSQEIQFSQKFNLALQLQLEYQLKNQKVKYYFKRWIWIQMPWIATDVSSDFSLELAKISQDAQQLTINDQLLFYNKLNKICSDHFSQKFSIFYPSFVKPFQKTKTFKPKIHLLERIPAQRTLPKINLSTCRPNCKDSVSMQPLFITENGGNVARMSGQRMRSVMSNASLMFKSKFDESLVIEKVKKQVFVLRKELDSIKFQSKKIQETIENDNKKHAELLAFKEAQQRCKVIEKIRQKFSKLQLHQKEFAMTELVNDRFKLIIKICRLNQTSCKEWIEYLNQFNNKIKKMIKLERQSIDKLIKMDRQLKLKIHKQRKQKFTEKSMKTLICPTQRQFPVPFIPSTVYYSQETFHQPKADQFATRKAIAFTKRMIINEEDFTTASQQRKEQLLELFRVQLRTTRDCRKYLELKQKLQNFYQYQQKVSDYVIQLQAKLESQRRLRSLIQINSYAVKTQPSSLSHSNSSLHSLSKYKLVQIKTKAHNLIYNIRKSLQTAYK